MSETTAPAKKVVLAHRMPETTAPPAKRVVCKKWMQLNHSVVVERLRNPNEPFFVRDAYLGQNGHLFKFVPRDDPQFFALALTAIEQTGGAALQHCFGRKDLWYDLAKHAVQYGDGGALVFVQKDSKEYGECAEYVVLRNSESLVYVWEDWSGYFDLAKRTVERDESAIKYVPWRFSGYEELATIAVQREPIALREVKTHFPGFGRIAEIAVKKEGDVLRFVPTDRDDFGALAKMAVKQDGLALQYVPKERPDFLALAILALQQTSNAMWAIEKGPLREPLLVFAVGIDPQAMREVDTEHPQYVALAKSALERDGDALRHVQRFDCYGTRAMTDAQYRELAAIAVFQNKSAVNHIDKKYMWKAGELKEFQHIHGASPPGGKPVASIKRKAEEALTHVVHALESEKDAMRPTMYKRLNVAVYEGVKMLD